MSDDEGISIYDEVEIEDMTFDEAMGVYQFPCPCGDKFQITLEDLLDEQDIAVCPSCSLMIRVIFDLDDLPKPPTSGTSGGQAWHNSRPSAVSTTPSEELEASIQLDTGKSATTSGILDNPIFATPSNQCEQQPYLGLLPSFQRQAGP
ncbi:diphthamide biosynthesis 3 [Fusarium acutatum]|uniref:Diphthamide biosynthesis protein 3 n=1 Tax=Fusarium acutatum TaxID=78861 RepID=A0A8H4K258_9HYPO|nr:diphthamide biosynthesis 3 [Fusarium acutatum]